LIGDTRLYTLALSLRTCPLSLRTYSLSSHLHSLSSHLHSLHTCLHFALALSLFILALYSHLSSLRTCLLFTLALSSRFVLSLHSSSLYTCSYIIYYIDKYLLFPEPNIYTYAPQYSMLCCL